MTRTHPAAARTDLPVREGAAGAGQVEDRTDASRGIWPLALAGGGGGVVSAAAAAPGALGSTGAGSVIAIGGAPAQAGALGAWSGGAASGGLEDAPVALPPADGGSVAAPALAATPSADAGARLAGVDVGEFTPPAAASAGFGAPPMAVSAYLDIVPAATDPGMQSVAGGGEAEDAEGGSEGGLAGLFGFLSDLFDAGPFQANVSFSDHDATSISASITYIGSIVDSIVVLGGNVAIATALNIAPVTQANWGGVGGAGGGGTDQLNLALTDNDAAALAFAGTFIGEATNSQIQVGGTKAASLALNVAPVTQTNLAVIGDTIGDAPTGGRLGPAELAQLNGAMGENDALAEAQTALLVGEEALAAAQDAVDLGIAATPHAGTGAALLAILAQPESLLQAASGPPPSEIVPVALDPAAHLDDGLLDAFA